MEPAVSDAVADARAEYDAFAAFLERVSAPDWERPTVFFGWTVRDEVMHLHLVDQFGLVALEGEEAFGRLVAEVRAGQARGRELSQVMRDRYGHLSPAALLAAWRDGYDRLLSQIAARTGDARMPWFGPEMGVLAFATARQMEVWAHGQDVYDLLRVRRPAHDRIRNICDLGVRTQGWSFRNRGLERPAPPEVRLTAPSGDTWTWTQGAPERIVGPAEDFALVVTQRRHVQDTALTVEGEGARAWMEIAQCFAGAPETGPAPGVREVRYPSEDKIDVGASLTAPSPWSPAPAGASSSARRSWRARRGRSSTSRTVSQRSAMIRTTSNARPGRSRRTRPDLGPPLQPAVMPRSATKQAPWTALARGDARNSRSSVMSSGWLRPRSPL